MRRDLGTGIRLPLSALEQASACDLPARVAAYTAHHGHPPGESSTWAEWCAVTLCLDDRLWAVAHALPLIYPARRAELLRVVVEVAYRAALRAQPSDPDPRVAEALALTRRWLDGEAVPSDTLRAAAADAAAHASYLAAYAAAAATVRAAAYAAAAYAAAYAYAATAATAAAAVYAATDTEREQQLEDLDELLAGLRLDAALERAYAGGVP